MITRKPFVITAIAAVLVIIIAYGYARYSTVFPSTDDAYIQANIVNIAPQITGPVASISVQDHQAVKTGQLLFTIDPQPFLIALAHAQAVLAQNVAEFDTQRKDTVRIMTLVDKGQMSKADGDDAQGKLAQLAAAVKIAQSNVAQATLDLQHTQIVAPANGFITQFTLRKGQMVQAGTSLFALVETNQWWVDANYKETDLGRIKIGQPATIKIDIYPDVTFKGVVQGISAGSGATFALLPPENATGNWVKVTQRFAVRINILNPDRHYPLRVGASATVRIDTRKS